MKPASANLDSLYDDGPAAMACLGLLDGPERELLSATLDAGRAQLGPAWEASAAKREIFWINLWQRTAGGAPMDLGRVDDLDGWVRDLAARAYGGTDAELDGYGFIINPIGSKTQPWHLDYTMGYSTIFIPLSRLTTQNCAQYAVLPAGGLAEARVRMAQNLDVIDLNALVDTCGHVSVRQLLVPPFSVIRMDFGTIHRGISNTGTFERIMFWISVCRRGDDKIPLEPVVELIHKT